MRKRDDGKREKRAELVVKTLAAHPYLCALAVCLALNPFYLGSYKYVPADIPWLRAAADFVTDSGFGGAWAALTVFALIVLFCCLCGSREYRSQMKGLLIMGGSFALKFSYVFYTSIETRQHDVGIFGDIDQHAGYIEYLLFNGGLPDFDVRGYWQFYHPPLHHAISAAWIYISENIFGVDYLPARESLQTLTLFYSMAILISGYKILRHFKLEGTALYAPLALIAFHPTFIFFSGSINNDVLAAAFMTGAVVCALKWYEQQSVRGIVKIALCVGLGMMTKLSAALVAPPIAVLFLVVLIRKFKTSRRRLFGQFAVFGLVCVPLGVWYPVRNLVRFDVPLNYVQEMDPKVLQYIGDMDFWTRVTDFSPSQFYSIFEQFVWQDQSGVLRGYNEYNPLISLLKTSVFGEFVRVSSSDLFMLAVCVALFWLAAVAAAVSFVCMILFAAKGREGEDAFPGRFLALFHILLLVSYYKFACDYPFVCTMNFRYITPTVITGALFYGLMMRRLSESGRDPKRAAFEQLMAVFALLFSVFSAMECMGLNCL